MILTNKGYKMRHKGKSFLFPLYKPMNSAFYKWFRNRPTRPIVFEIEPPIDPFEHMTELERKLTKVYE